MSTTANDGTGEGPAPAQLLAEVQALRDRASAAAHAYWLPLLLFGALICGSLAFYLGLGPARPVFLTRPGRGLPCGPGLGDLCGAHVVVHVFHIAALGYYWQLAIPAGVVLTVLWYRWRGNKVGLRTPALGFLITGLILSELVLLVPLLLSQSSSPGVQDVISAARKAGALVIIAALLWVLAWTERSRVLAAVTAVYFVVVLVVAPFTGGGIEGGSTGTPDLPLASLRLIGLIPALVLLGAGLAALLVQRRRLSELHTNSTG